MPRHRPNLTKTACRHLWIFQKRRPSNLFLKVWALKTYPLKHGDKSLARGSILKKMAEIYEDRFKTQDSRFKTDNLQLTTHNCIYATYEVMFVKAVKL